MFFRNEMNVFIWLTVYPSETNPLQRAAWCTSEMKNNGVLYLHVIPLATFDPLWNSAGGEKEFSLTKNAIFNKYS